MEHYITLGLLDNPYCTIDEITERYQQLIQPLIEKEKRGGVVQAEDIDRRQEIQEAFAALGNPKRRDKYDFLNGKPGNIYPPTITVTESDIESRKPLTIDTPRRVLCTDCKADSYGKCEKCLGGVNSVVTIVSSTTHHGKGRSVVQTCECGGSGNLKNSNECRRCESKGWLFGNLKIALEPEPGIIRWGPDSDGTLILKHFGDESRNPRIWKTGDIYLTFLKQSDPGFRRRQFTEDSEDNEPPGGVSSPESESDESVGQFRPESNNFEATGVNSETENRSTENLDGNDDYGDDLDSPLFIIKNTYSVENPPVERKDEDAQNTNSNANVDHVEGLEPNAEDKTLSAHTGSEIMETPENIGGSENNESPCTEQDNPVVQDDERMDLGENNDGQKESNDTSVSNADFSAMAKHTPIQSQPEGHNVNCEEAGVDNATDHHSTDSNDESHDAMHKDDIESSRHDSPTDFDDEKSEIVITSTKTASTNANTDTDLPEHVEELEPGSSKQIPEKEKSTLPPQSWSGTMETFPSENIHPLMNNKNTCTARDNPTVHDDERMDLGENDDVQNESNATSVSNGDFSAMAKLTPIKSQPEGHNVNCEEAGVDNSTDHHSTDSNEESHVEAVHNAPNPDVFNPLEANSSETAEFVNSRQNAMKLDDIGTDMKISAPSNIGNVHIDVNDGRQDSERIIIDDIVNIIIDDIVNNTEDEMTLSAVDQITVEEAMFANDNKSPGGNVPPDYDDDLEKSDLVISCTSSVSISSLEGADKDVQNTNSIANADLPEQGYLKELELDSPGLNSDKEQLTFLVQSGSGAMETFTSESIGVLKHNDSTSTAQDNPAVHDDDDAGNETTDFDKNFHGPDESNDNEENQEQLTLPAQPGFGTVTFTLENIDVLMHKESLCTARDNPAVYYDDAKFPKPLLHQATQEKFDPVENDHNTFQGTTLNEFRSHPFPVAIEECLTAEEQKTIPTPINVETGGIATLTDLETFKLPSSDVQGHDGQNKEELAPKGANRKSINKRKISATETAAKKTIKKRRLFTRLHSLPVSANASQITPSDFESSDSAFNAVAVTVSTGSLDLSTEVSTSSIGRSNSTTEDFSSTLTTGASNSSAEVCTSISVTDVLNLSVEPTPFTTDTSTPTEKETRLKRQPSPDITSMSEEIAYRKSRAKVKPSSLHNMREK